MTARRFVSPSSLLTIAVAIAVVTTFVRYIPALNDLDKIANDNSKLSFADREFAGGNGIVVNQEAAYEARLLIPRDAAYRVVAGKKLRHAKPLTRAFVEQWFAYFMMPQRPSADARWIICYGCDRSALGGRYVRRWSDRNRISIGRIR